MMWVPAGQQDLSSPRMAVTFWLPVLLLPPASVAVHVTVVTPSGKVVGAFLVGVSGPQLSVAIAIPMLAFVQLEIVTAPGTVRVGGVTSRAVTFAVQVAVRRPSETVRVTGLTPGMKGPEALSMKVSGSPFGSE